MPYKHPVYRFGPARYFGHISRLGLRLLGGAALWVFLLSASMSAAYGVVRIRDTEVERVLYDMSVPIMQAAGMPAQSVEFIILHDDRLNAFVTPGMRMFLHTRLIDEAETPGMLLSVIAHEMGHIASGHLLQYATRGRDLQVGALLTYALGAVAAALGGGEGATAVVQAGQHLLLRNMLAYSRTKEQQADQLALQYLEQASISPHAMLDMFNRLRREQHRKLRDDVDPYLMTHPLSKERIAYIRAHLAASEPASSKPAYSAQVYARVRAKLYAFLQPPRRTLMRYPSTDTSVAARYARAIAWYRIPDIDKALMGVNALIEQYPDDPYFHELKGQILFEHGRVGEAQVSYQRAVALLKDAPLLRIALARAYLAHEVPGAAMDAIGELQAALLQARDSAQGWWLLAQAYGKTGQMGAAALAQAEHAILIKDKKALKRYLRQAKEHVMPASARWQQLQDLQRALEQWQDEDD